MNAGDAFFWDRGGKGEHLWVVLSDPNAEKVVVVSFSSIRKEGYDSACTTPGAEHPALPKPSYVFYTDAICANGEKLRATYPSFRKPTTPIPVNLLQRMRDGAMKSDCCESGCRKILLDQKLVKLPK